MSAPSGSRTNLQPQKQDEYSQVTVSLVLGDITAGQMRRWRCWRERTPTAGAGHGRSEPRAAMGQSGQVQGCIGGLPLRASDGGAGTITDVTSCPGAESCRLAVTQSRGLARLIGDGWNTQPALVRDASDVTDQDQWLPQRMRTAPCRADWIPGQHPQGWRSASCRSIS